MIKSATDLPWLSNRSSVLNLSLQGITMHEYEGW